MSQPLRSSHWWWSAGIGLVLIVAVVCVLLVGRNQASTDPAVVETSKPSAAVPSVRPTVDPAVALVDTPPQLPSLDFAPGSVEEACGLNELPPYWVGDGSLERNKDHTNALESIECQIALETHMNTVNPYHFLWSDSLIALPVRFVVLDDPLTFERVFADPTGDAARVQDALSRPECLLQGDETNWELAETCHADAILNYAVINSLCFRYVLSRGASYKPDDNPTPEQDRLMWKQDFEDAWVDAQCKGLDPELKLNLDRYPALYELVKPVGGDRFGLVPVERKIPAFLVELAARLGDDTAGLVGKPFNSFPYGEGFKYGRFSNVFPSGGFNSFWQAGAHMRMYRPRDEPTELLLKAFRFLTLMDARRPDPRDEIEFDWEWVVRYICVPDTLPPSLADAMGADEPIEIRSCKEIVHEIRQRDIKFAPLHKTLDKFEQVALELGVYE